MTTNERIEKLILPACESIRETFKNADEIDAQARSKMSAFGASIIMGSLKATIMNFCDDKADDKDINSNMMLCLWKLLRRQDCFGTIYQGKSENVEGLKDFVMESKGDSLDKTKEDILTAATAIKMALNLFPLKNEKR